MKSVIVIGGGVVGLTTAWSLLEAGFKVTLLERASEVATGASHANGGQLSYRYVSPLADAGVPFKALGWLFKADSPQQFRPELRWQQWSWMASFLANCTSAANRRTTQRLLKLGSLSQEVFNELSARIPAESIALRTPGKLVVYRQPKEFAKAASNADASAIASGEVRVLNTAECIALEPALADAQTILAGGTFSRSEAVADCRVFCLQLLDLLVQSSDFKLISNALATGFIQREGRAVAVRLASGELAADEIVIAAGLHSVALAASLGIRLPLYPIKGYSLSAPIGTAHHAPEISVTDFEKKVLYARIGDQLRIAAMADLVGENEALDPQRVASLFRLVKSTLPNAADYSQAVPWTGLRPATPSGAPILGATPLPGVWLNVGHGALGFTLAGGSARILTALISQREAPIPLDGLSLEQAHA
jgi:D-amino-acid dehydrogenase